MLIPRYSLRWLLGLTTFSAGVSLILSYAVRGHAWAIGAAAGLWSLVIVALAYVVAFLAAWCIAQLGASASASRRGDSGGSPFAADDAPLATPACVAAQAVAESPPPMTG